MESRRADDNLDGRVKVLEAVMPRIEKNILDTNIVLFKKLDDIQTNMVTKKELEQQLAPSKTDFLSFQAADNDNKKKQFFIQCQIIALAVLFVIDLFFGASKTLEVAGTVVSKIP